MHFISQYSSLALSIILVIVVLNQWMSTGPTYIKVLQIIEMESYLSLSKERMGFYLLYLQQSTTRYLNIKPVLQELQHCAMVISI